MSIPPVSTAPSAEAFQPPASEVPFNPIDRDLRLPKPTDLPKSIDLGDVQLKPLPEGRGGLGATVPLTPTTDVTVSGSLGQPAVLGVSQSAGALGGKIEANLSGPANLRGELGVTIGSDDKVNVSGKVLINPSDDNVVRGSAAVNVPLGGGTSIEGSVAESADGTGVQTEFMIKHKP